VYQKIKGDRMRRKSNLRKTWLIRLLPPVLVFFGWICGDVWLANLCFNHLPAWEYIFWVKAAIVVFLIAGTAGIIGLAAVVTTAIMLAITDY